MSNVKETVTVPFVVNAGIDGISLVFTDSDNASFYHSIIKEYGSKYAYAYGKLKGRHPYACKIPINDIGHDLIVSSNNDGQVKIHWNAMYTTISQDIALRNLLQELVAPYFNQLWESPCIQDVHRAVDIAYADPDDLCCKKSHQRKSMVLTNELGQTETIYLGGERPSGVIYNKSLHLKRQWDSDKRSKYPLGEDILIPPAFDMTRIEDRKRVLKISPKDLVESGDNPFNNYYFYWYSELERSGLISKLFIDSCHYRGLKGALSRLSGYAKTEITKALEYHKHDLLNSKSVNIEVEHAYRKLMLLAPDKVWNRHLKAIDERLHEYQHTGIFSRHLVNQAKLGRKPLPHQWNILGASWTSPEWKQHYIGRPITRKMAEDLILNEYSSESLGVVIPKD